MYHIYYIFQQKEYIVDETRILHMLENSTVVGILPVSIVLDCVCGFLRRRKSLH